MASEKQAKKSFQCDSARPNACFLLGRFFMSSMDVEDAKREDEVPNVRDQDVTFVADPQIAPVHVDCTLFVRTQMDMTMTYIQHGRTWPPAPNVACLHDCHPFKTPPIPIVHRYDERSGKYHVYGVFCSANCAKMYIIEHEHGVTSRRMVEFLSMLRSEYGITGNIKPAPPRVRLQLFGGELTIEQFRTQFRHAHERLLVPPFVPACLTVLQTMSADSRENLSLALTSNPAKRARMEAADSMEIEP